MLASESLHSDIHCMQLYSTIVYVCHRFGKLLRLQYGGCQLRGAEIDTYLLEKTRVTHQPEKERNFHIFYQVLV